MKLHIFTFFGYSTTTLIVYNITTTPKHYLLRLDTNILFTGNHFYLLYLIINFKSILSYNNDFCLEQIYILAIKQQKVRRIIIFRNFFH